VTATHKRPPAEGGAQMADDLYGGYAPNPIFKNYIGLSAV